MNEHLKYILEAAADLKDENLYICLFSLHTKTKIYKCEIALPLKCGVERCLRVGTKWAKRMEKHVGKVCVCPNPLNAPHRLANNVAYINFAFIDCDPDKVPEGKTWDKQKAHTQLLNDTRMALVLDSGNGCHGYARLSPPIPNNKENAELFKKAADKLAEDYIDHGADSSVYNDFSHLLQLADLKNFKPGKPTTLSKLSHIVPGRSIDFKTLLPKDLQDKKNKKQKRKTTRDESITEDYAIDTAKIIKLIEKKLKGLKAGNRNNRLYELAFLLSKAGYNDENEIYDKLKLFIDECAKIGDFPDKEALGTIGSAIKAPKTEWEESVINSGPFKGMELTDLGFSKVIIDRLKDKVCAIRQVKEDQNKVVIFQDEKTGWVGWNFDVSYSQQDNEVFGYAELREMIKDITKEFVDWVKSIEPQSRYETGMKKYYTNQIPHFRSFAFVNQVLHELLVAKGVNVNKNAFFNHMGKIALADGVYNLNTHEFKTGFTKEEKILQRCTFKYDPSATCPQFLAHLKRSINDQTIIDYFQMALGDMITGYKKLEVILMLLGEQGGTGKSTILKVLKGMLGTYAYKAPTSAFAGNAGTVNNEGLAKMAGMRLVVTEEIPDDLLANSALLRDITGEEGVEAAKKYEHLMGFITQCMLILQGNYSLRTANNGGNDRRFRFIECDNKITEKERIPKFSEVLAIEYAGVFNWIIEGLKKLQHCHDNKIEIVVPNEIKDFTSEHTNKENVALDLMREYQLVSHYLPEASGYCAVKIQADKLCNLYKLHNKSYDIIDRKLISPNRMSGEFVSLKVPKIRSRGARYYYFCMNKTKYQECAKYFTEVKLSQNEWEERVNKTKAKE